MVKTKTIRSLIRIFIGSEETNIRTSYSLEFDGQPTQPIKTAIQRHLISISQFFLITNLNFINYEKTPMLSIYCIALVLQNPDRR